MDDTNATPEILVETDDRGRVSLARLGAEPRSRYLARTDPDGTVTLSPAVVISELEHRLLSNPALVEQIEDNRAHPERLTKLQRPTTARG